MQKVPVLDTSKQTLAPTDSIRARRLLKQNKAAVFKKFPFTIILKREDENPSLPDLTLKIDPGSKTTGVALVNQATGDIVFAAEISHHGEAIKASLESRKSLRRGRRNRKTRYRKPRFLNRTRVEGWVPPSLNSRISNVTTWVKRLARIFPIANLAMELVKFDLQKMQNPEISGIQYQQGELAGYEVREYLLEKFNRTCAYCKKKNLALQIEHINARSRGGSNRVSNLTLACQSCNQKKGRMSAAEFGFPEVEKQAKKPLRDAAAVNASPPDSAALLRPVRARPPSTVRGLGRSPRPMLASSSESSVIVAGRSSGFFIRQRITSAASAGGIGSRPSVVAPGGGGASVRI